MRVGLLLIAASMSVASQGSSWVQASGVSGWRGDGSGRYTDAAAPLQWDRDEHVVWKTETPGWSNAGPIIAGDRLFVLAEPDVLLCLDKRTGDILWQRSNSYADIAPAGEGETVSARMQQAEAINRALQALRGRRRQLERQAKDNPDDTEARSALEALGAEEARLRDDLRPVEAYAMPAAHAANGTSSATPVTDGAHVYVFFGTGTAAAYDLEGNRLWARILEKPTAGWGHSASPVLADDRLVIHVRDVHGLDPATGETVWTVKSAARWGASVGAMIDGQPVVITANGELIRAHDGHVLAAGLHRLEYNAPIVHDGVVYFIEHGGKAYRLPATADGSTQPERLWQTAPPKERYYASPLYHDGHLYAIHQKGVFSVIDAQTGQVLKSETLGGLRRTVYSSVSLAGSHLVLGAEGGSIVLLAPGPDGEVVATSTIGSFRSTPVFERDRTYIRTLNAMICLRP